MYKDGLVYEGEIGVADFDFVASRRQLKKPVGRCTAEFADLHCKIHRRFIGNGSKRYNGELCVGCRWWQVIGDV